MDKHGFYVDWGQKKEEIDALKSHIIPRVRDIWWVKVGYNIGSEIYGKGQNYTRPVIVINAENTHIFTGIPLTSKAKNGKYSPIIKLPNGTLNTALITQIRSFDRKRLVSRHCQLSYAEFEIVKLSLKDYLKL